MTRVGPQVWTEAKKVNLILFKIFHIFESKLIIP